MSDEQSRGSSPQFADPREWPWRSADGLSYAFVVIREGDGHYPAMVDISESDFGSTLLPHDCQSLALVLREAAKVALKINAKRAVWGR